MELDKDVSKQSLESVGYYKHLAESNNPYDLEQIPIDVLRGIYKDAVANSVPKDEIKNILDMVKRELVESETKKDIGKGCTYCNNTCKNYSKCALLHELEKLLLTEDVCYELTVPEILVKLQELSDMTEKICNGELQKYSMYDIIQLKRYYENELKEKQKAIDEKQKALSEAINYLASVGGRQCK